MNLNPISLGPTGVVRNRLAARIESNSSCIRHTLRSCMKIMWMTSEVMREIYQKNLFGSRLQNERYEHFALFHVLPVSLAEKADVFIFFHACGGDQKSTRDYGQNTSGQ